MSTAKSKHIDPDEYHGTALTLHDCTANHITHQNNTLCFSFPDGFWITPHHKENFSEKTVRTDPSAVEFSVKNLGDAMVYVFTRHRWLWFQKTSVDIWDTDRLIALVNSSKCTIEFITQYRTYGEQMWHCAIRSNRKPYYRECQIYLPETEATFFWNDLCPEREW